MGYRSCVASIHYMDSLLRTGVGSVDVFRHCKDTVEPMGIEHLAHMYIGS